MALTFDLFICKMALNLLVPWERFMPILIFLPTDGQTKRRTLKGKNREEGNGKSPLQFSLDMIPIDGCFEDVLQLWPLLFDVNCRLPPVDPPAEFFYYIRPADRLFRRIFG